MKFNTFLDLSDNLFLASSHTRPNILIMHVSIHSIHPPNTVIF